LRQTPAQRYGSPAAARCGAAWSQSRRSSQHGAVLVDGDVVDVDDLGCEVCQMAVIQVKLAFEGAIRDPPLTPEHGHSLRQDLLERHCLPSMPRVALPCVSPVAYLTRTSDGTPCWTARGKKALRPTSIASDSLPHFVSAHAIFCSLSQWGMC